jgi:hypothetical protein
MKLVPKNPYLGNIMAHYCECVGTSIAFVGSDYREWLKRFGFKVPVRTDYLEFPDDFPDHDLTMFILRWS